MKNQNLVCLFNCRIFTLLFFKKCALFSRNVRFSYSKTVWILCYIQFLRLPVPFCQQRVFSWTGNVRHLRFPHSITWKKGRRPWQQPRSPVTSSSRSSSASSTRLLSSAAPWCATIGAVSSLSAPSSGASGQRMPPPPSGSSPVKARVAPPVMDHLLPTRSPV